MQSLGLDSTELTVLWGLNKESGPPPRVTEGAVFTNGEIFLIDAFEYSDENDTIILTPVTLDVGNPVRFADTVERAVHKDYKYELSVGTAGGQSVELTNDLPQLSDRLKTIVGAEQFTLDKINELVDSASTYTTIGQLETAVNSINNSLDDYHDYIQLATNKPQGSYVAHGTQTIDTTGHEIVFSTARIAQGDIVVPAGKKRAIRLISNFRFVKNSDSKYFKVAIRYRVGTGPWQLIRERRFWTRDHNYATMLGVLELTSTPANYLEFSMHIEAESSSINFSDDNDLEFDILY